MTSTSDKERLELAAKAAGYLETASVQDGYGFISLRVMDETGDWTGQDWNPLTDDGDALRLAVKLDIPFSSESANGTTWICKCELQIFEPHNNDPYAATRRAIVRAAAEIGKML